MNKDDISVQTSISIVCITNNGESASYFDQCDFTLSGNLQRQLSEQISAVNFRLRSSPTDYASDWHIAHDPTLLIILSGCMQIELRNGQQKQFRAGEMFIAQDYLVDGLRFDNELHGHRANVVGVEELKVLHLKLNKRDS